MTASAQAQLEAHFDHHKLMLDRFREFGSTAVLRMWERQTSELGNPLTAFEREALVERYCELFGVWPLQSEQS